MSVHLLDGNVLVALTDSAHVHHHAALRWFSDSDAPFATCPITQGTLLRMLLRHGAVDTPDDAAQVLAQLCAHPRHRFWADDIDYLQVRWQGLLGHRQVTDAYLASLVRVKGGRLVSFDKGLAAVQGELVMLLG
jgi:hypothetical protein